MLLRDVMTEAVVTAPPDLPAREVAQLMRQYGVGSVVMGEADMEVEQAAEEMISHAIRRLPVVDGDRVVEVLTLGDLVARAGELHLAQVLTSDITRAAPPGL